MENFSLLIELYRYTREETQNAADRYNRHAIRIRGGRLSEPGSMSPLQAARRLLEWLVIVQLIFCTGPVLCYAAGETEKPDGAAAYFSVAGSWSDGTDDFTQYDVKVTNLSAARISGWSLEITVPADTRVSQFWNCTVKTENGTLYLKPADYTNTLEAGASSQGIGLIVTSGSDERWSRYKLDCMFESGEPETFTGESAVQSAADAAGTGEKNPDGGENAGEDGSQGDETAGLASAPAQEGQAMEKHVITIKSEDNKPVSALHVEGTSLTDEDGQAVRLQGVSTHGLGVFPEYVNEDAFRTLRDDFGADVIRLALYTQAENGYCEGDDARRAQQEELIDKGVKACTDLGMYVIVDWHILSDGNPLAHENEALRFFDKMSAKYADLPNVIYEICNEPNGSSWKDQIRPYAEKVIPVIRKNAPDSVILVGTNTWSQDVNEPAAYPLDAKNVMYCLHFYAGTHKEDLRKKLEDALDAGAPVFISESSICDASGNGGIDYDSANAWRELIARRGLSFIEWNLSNKNETSAMILPDCGRLSGWTEEELSQSALWYRGVMRSFAGLG